MSRHENRCTGRLRRQFPRSRVLRLRRGVPGRDRALRDRGVAAGEPVVLGYDTRKSDLVRAALPRPDAVTFLTDAALYATPAGAIEAYRRQFERYVAAGAEQVRIAGDVPHEGNGGRFAGWDRYESAVNAVWHDYPVWSRCLYDATTVPDDVRDVVERTHRRLVRPDGGAVASPRYQEFGAFQALAPAADPLEATPPVVQLVDAALEQTQRVVANAARGRVDDPTCDDLVFAVAEAVVNAQLHGRPPVTVRAWAGPGRIVVRVHDTGPGPADVLTGLVPAPAGAEGAGLGLWLAHQLPTLDVELLPGTDGFTVRLRGGRPPRRGDGGPIGTVVPLRAGAAHDLPGRPPGLHAVDGDGSSLCELVDPAHLDPLDDVPWREVPDDRQCPSCRLLVEPAAALPERR